MPYALFLTSTTIFYTSSVLLFGDLGGTACLTPESSSEGGRDGKLRSRLQSLLSPAKHQCLAEMLHGVSECLEVLGEASACAVGEILQFFPVSSDGG